MLYVRKTVIDENQLHWLYTRSDVTMQAIADRFGLSKRQLIERIKALRIQNPDRWPKRDGAPPLLKRLGKKTRRAVIFTDITRERDKQDHKHPKFPHSPGDRLAILVEEVGEVATAIQNQDPINLREELTQVAATAVRWLEQLEIRGDI